MAPMPDRPPLTNGFSVCHVLLSAISEASARRSVSASLLQRSCATHRGGEGRKGVAQAGLYRRGAAEISQCSAPSERYVFLCFRGHRGVHRKRDGAAPGRALPLPCRFRDPRGAAASAPQRHRRPARANRRTCAPVLTKPGFAGRCIASRRRCLRAGAHCTPGLLGCCAGTHVSHIPCFPDAGIGAPHVAQPASLARAAAARPPPGMLGLLAQYTRGFFCNRDHSPRPHARAKQPASAASLGLACSHARNPAAFQLLWTCTDQPPHAHRARPHRPAGFRATVVAFAAAAQLC